MGQQVRGAEKERVGGAPRHGLHQLVEDNVAKLLSGGCAQHVVAEMMNLTPGQEQLTCQAACSRIAMNVVLHPVPGGGAHPGSTPMLTQPFEPRDE